MTSDIILLTTWSSAATYKSSLSKGNNYILLEGASDKLYKIKALYLHIFSLAIVSEPY